MNDHPLDGISSISEIAIGYALLTVGTDARESKPLRLRCADAARELEMNVTADEIEKSILGQATTLSEVVSRIEDYSKRAS